MDIIEYAQIIEQDIEIKSQTSRGRRWTARFINAEVKNDKSDPGLRGFYGVGETPQQALVNYIHQIRGKRLVFNSTKEDLRTEFNVPDTITVETLTVFPRAGVKNA